jgi:hypothetical protein
MKLLACALVVLAAQTGVEPRLASVTNRPAVSSFEAQILNAARGYRSLRKVDDAMRVAPVMCAPVSIGPRARTSQSQDSGTHGRKLYVLFAKDPEEYLDRERPVSVGQQLVKESWVPSADGRPRERSALFVMMKLDPATPGTDQGWIYGTTTADAKTVTGAGRIGSCMQCHEKAPRDRLFGLPDR